MLSKLLGPLALVDSLSETVTLRSRVGMWMDEWGAMLVASDLNNSAHPDNVYILSPHGILSRLGSGGLHVAGFGQTYDGDLVLATSTSDWVRAHFPSLGPKESFHSGGGVTTFAVLSDRLLTVSQSAVNARQYDGTLLGSECLLEGVLVDGFCSILPYDVNYDKGSSLWWVFNHTSGKLYLYDAVAKAEVTGRRAYLPTGGSHVFYSPALGIFGFIKDSFLYLYSTEPEATTLSSPVFASTPTAGNPVEVSVTLTGSNGEPCPDRVIAFTATLGSFVKANVKTDSTGKATAIYHPPFNATSGIQVTATLPE